MIDWRKIDVHTTKVQCKDGIDLYINNYSAVQDILEELNINKKAYSYIVREFLPIERYKVRVGDDIVTVKLNKDFGLESYNKTYTYLIEQGIKPKGLDTFLWLVDHTDLLELSYDNQILVGDEEFNAMVRGDATLEVVEIIKDIPGLRLEKDKLKAFYSNQMDNYFTRNNLKVAGEYILVSKGGYELPFIVDVERDELIEWIADLTELVNHNIKCSVQGNKVLIRTFGKMDWLHVLIQLYKVLKVQEPIRKETQDFKLTPEITFTYGKWDVTIVNSWLDLNKRYAMDLLQLVKTTDFSFVSEKKTLYGNYYKLLGDSKYDKDQHILSIGEVYYAELGIQKEDVVKDLTEVSMDIYKEFETDVGDIVPITHNINKVKIATPYYKVKDNHFKYAYYPNITLDNYTIEPIQESYLHQYIMNEPRLYDEYKLATEGAKADFEAVKTIDWQVIFELLLKDLRKADFTVRRKPFNSVRDRLLNLPSVLSIKEDEQRKVWCVTKGFKEIELSTELDDIDLLSRVIYDTKDEVTQDYKKEVVNLLLAIFEQRTWKPTLDRDDTLWQDYLESIIGLGSSAYYNNIWTDELTEKIKEPPLTEEEWKSVMSNDIDENNELYKAFNISNKEDEDEYDDSQVDYKEVLSQEDDIEVNEDGEVDILSILGG